MNIKIIEKEIDGIKKYYYEYRKNGKKISRVCKNCISMEAAKYYVSRLKYLDEEQYLVKNIAKNMYLQNSEHLGRLNSFGKNICEETRRQNRFFIERIINDFGDENLQKFQIRKLEMFLIQDTVHSCSWKNTYLSVFASVYKETMWCCSKQVLSPEFMKFKRNSKKADVLTTSELKKFFDKKYWNDKPVEYMLFLCMVSFGLRLGEARALKVNQFIWEKNILVINGFCKRNGERTVYNKKGSLEKPKLRVAPINDEIGEKMRKYFIENNLSSDDYVFMKENKPLTHDSLEFIFKRKKSMFDFGSKRIIPHSLRYTYVTRMRRECDIETVRNIVGHTTNEMTDYYTKFGIDELAKKIEGSEEAVNHLFK